MFGTFGAGAEPEPPTHALQGVANSTNWATSTLWGFFNSHCFDILPSIFFAFGPIETAYLDNLFIACW